MPDDSHLSFVFYIIEPFESGCMFCLRMVAPSKFVSKLYNPLYSLYAGRGSRQLVAGVAVLVIVFEQ